MAKRLATKLKSVKQSTASAAPRRASSSASSGWSKTFKGFISAPATMYVAGGIGVAVLARFAYKYYNSHPEISDYIKENFESVESKLKEYKNSIVSADLEDAQH